MPLLPDPIDLQCFAVLAQGASWNLNVPRSCTPQGPRRSSMSLPKRGKTDRTRFFVLTCGIFCCQSRHLAPSHARMPSRKFCFPSKVYTECVRQCGMQYRPRELSAGLHVCRRRYLRPRNCMSAPDTSAPACFLQWSARTAFH